LVSLQSEVYQNSAKYPPVLPENSYLVTVRILYIYLHPPEGVTKGSYTFSLGEKAGMRGEYNQSVIFLKFPHPNPLPGGEGAFTTPS